MDALKPTKCDVSDIVLEIIRFCSHIILLHVLYSIVDNKETFLGISFMKTIIFTIVAIILYNFILKKFFGQVIEKMKLITTDKECIIKRRIDIEDINDNDYEQKSPTNPRKFE